MADSFNKKEKEKLKAKKKKEKLERKEARKEQKRAGNDLDAMMAYIDENGNIVDTPPDPTKKKEVKAEDIDLSPPKREKEDLTTTKKGRVEFYNDEKGYGFVKDLDTQEKYFMHVHGMLDEAREGDIVTFDLEQGMKGLNAVNVKMA